MGSFIGEAFKADPDLLFGLDSWRSAFLRRTIFSTRLSLALHVLAFCNDRPRNGGCGIEGFLQLLWVSIDQFNRFVESSGR